MAHLLYPYAENSKEIDKQREIDELTNFVAKKPGVYDGGMTQIVLSHVMRETAKYCNCDFADTCSPDAVSQAVQEQHASENDIIICSAHSIDKEQKEKCLKTLLASLAAIKAADKYKKILLPIAASGYGVNHAMTLAIEGNNAYIFEQFGGASAYGEVKKDLAQALSDAGYAFTANAQPLTNGNRLDCATVNNAIIFEALSAGSVADLSKKIAKKSPFFTHQEIDKQHKIDKDFARAALKDINEGHRDDRNNSADIILLQKLLKKCSHNNLEDDLKLAEEFWKADDKAKFVAEYQPKQSQENLDIDDNIDSPAHDDGWKDEVRKAVGEAKKSVKTTFEEYQDAEHPEHLCFRDGDDKMIFSSRNKVAVEGDIQTFRTVCETALNLGFKSVNFGKFEEHPEYKAKLYLACLEKDLKMNNAPKLEELKEYPEYADIMKLYVPKQRTKLSDSLKKTAAEFNKANTAAEKDPEYKRLKRELQDAKKNKDSDAIEKAKAALAQNPAHKALEQAQHQYKDAMKAAINFYIEYGSENSKPDQTPEERRKKIEKHLTEYKAEDFFAKEFISKKELDEGKTPAPRQAKKEEIDKYAPSQRIAREIMNMNGRGK